MLREFCRRSSLFRVGRAIGDVERDEEGLKTTQTLAQNIAWLLKKLNA
jgi:hypothetical protein